jgi:hypothetical protein
MLRHSLFLFFRVNPFFRIEPGRIKATHLMTSGTSNLISGVLSRRQS